MYQLHLGGHILLKQFQIHLHSHTKVVELLQVGVAVAMVIVAEEAHGTGAPREAVEEAGAILTIRAILHHQEDSKIIRPVPNVVQAEMATPPLNAAVVAFFATHENMLGDTVLTRDINRT